MTALPQAESLLGHFLTIALPIILAFLLKEWSSTRREKKRAARLVQEKLLQDSELTTLLRNYRLHDHTEQSGPLSAEQIRYPREK